MFIFPNMRPLPLLYKLFSKKIFLTSSFSNDSALLEIFLISSPLIFFNFTTFITSFFQNLNRTHKPKKKIEFTPSFPENFVDKISNSFGIQNSKTHVLTFLQNVLLKNFYLQVPFLKITILTFITFSIYL